MVDRQISDGVLAKIRAAQQELDVVTGEKLWLIRPLTDDEHQWLLTRIKNISSNIT